MKPISFFYAFMALAVTIAIAKAAPNQRQLYFAQGKPLILGQAPANLKGNSDAEVAYVGSALKSLYRNEMQNCSVQGSSTSTSTKGKTILQLKLTNSNQVFQALVQKQTNSPYYELVSLSPVPFQSQNLKTLRPKPVGSQQNVPRPLVRTSIKKVSSSETQPLATIVPRDGQTTKASVTSTTFSPLGASANSSRRFAPRLQFLDTLPPSLVPQTLRTLNHDQKLRLSVGTGFPSQTSQASQPRKTFQTPQNLQNLQISSPSLVLGPIVQATVSSSSLGISSASTQSTKQTQSDSITSQASQSSSGSSSSTSSTPPRFIPWTETFKWPSNILNFKPPAHSAPIIGGSIPVSTPALTTPSSTSASSSPSETTRPDCSRLPNYQPLADYQNDPEWQRADKLAKETDPQINGAVIVSVSSRAGPSASYKTIYQSKSGQVNTNTEVTVVSQPSKNTLQIASTTTNITQQPTNSGNLPPSNGIFQTKTSAPPVDSPNLKWSYMMIPYSEKYQQLTNYQNRSEWREVDKRIRQTNPRLQGAQVVNVSSRWTQDTSEDSNISYQITYLLKSGEKLIVTQHKDAWHIQSSPANPKTPSQNTLLKKKPKYNIFNEISKIIPTASKSAQDNSGNRIREALTDPDWRKAYDLILSTYPPLKDLTVMKFSVKNGSGNANYSVSFRSDSGLEQYKTTVVQQQPQKDKLRVDYLLKASAVGAPSSVMTPVLDVVSERLEDNLFDLNQGSDDKSCEPN